MARTKNGTPPAYRKKKVRSHEYAYVRLNGQQIILGHYGTEESRREYARILAEWEVNDRRLPADLSDKVYTVQQLHDDYVRHCEVYYRKPDGVPTQPGRTQSNLSPTTSGSTNEPGIRRAPTLSSQQRPATAWCSRGSRFKTSGPDTMPASR